MPSQWWTEFNNQSLNLLVDKALSGNFGLKAAFSRLQQARFSAAKSGAELLPELTGSADASHLINMAGSERTESNKYSIGLAASYEVDLWGRLDSAEKAAKFDAMSAGEDLDAAAVSLSAQVARTIFQIIEQRLQLELIDEQVSINKDYLALVEIKFRAGKAAAADVLQQRQLVESSRGERFGAESDLRALEHQLAVLTGERPGRSPGRSNVADSLTFDALPELPPLPEVGRVDDWLRRRPDLRAAELRIQAADQRAAAAVAARFPKLSLSLRGETSAELVRDLFDDWLANLAANLAGPLLDFGRRRAEADRAGAVAEQALHDYGQTFLSALSEVETALIREARQAEYVASLDKQLKLSESAVEQIKDKYSKGAGDFTRYLSALQAHQRLQRTRLQSQRRLIEYRIDLYRAVAGRISEPELRKNESAINTETRNFQ